ncbi:cadherin repeat domain-containing protein [Croceicoccus hydrothermalis]|uniref:cadherin repeat domain-containing protein n=1 Tax=Croceicoccus hydrothermalis TaxID=2867964 RepID=UPI001EFB74FD|nr:cadherin repeat domain-containing protein [Croceicoccus hydrothermalis]
MTRSEAPTAVEQGQQAGSTATPANEAATPETSANTAETAKPMTAAELAALAAAASEAAVPQVESEEAPVEMADAAQAQAKAQAVFDEDEKEDEDDADAQDAPVDLAMGSEAAVFEAIAAADDARAAPGDEGEEASALGGESNGAPILAVAAVAAAGLGLYAVLDDNDDDIDLPEPEPENVAPVFTSETDVDFDENTDADEIVYTATATDADGDDITYSIDEDSDDFAAFTIDPDSGEVRFVESPDFETQDSYTLTVIATDSEGNSVSQDVNITINDIDEGTGAPTGTRQSIDEDNDGDLDTGAPFQAADGDFIFTDDPSVESNATILGFDIGDYILVPEGTEVFFGTGADDANDLEITFRGEDGETNLITIDDVLSDNATVFDEETAEAAVGEFLGFEGEDGGTSYDFFQFGDISVPVDTVA